MAGEPRNDYARTSADDATESVALNAQTFLDEGEVARRTVAALEAIALELRAARWDREGVEETGPDGRRLSDPKSVTREVPNGR